MLMTPMSNAINRNSALRYQRAAAPLIPSDFKWAVIQEPQLPGCYLPPNEPCIVVLIPPRPGLHYLILPPLKLFETAMSAFTSPMVELWALIYYHTAIKKGVGALPEMVSWEECSFIEIRGN